MAKETLDKEEAIKRLVHTARKILCYGFSGEARRGIRGSRRNIKHENS